MYLLVAALLVVPVQVFSYTQLDTSALNGDVEAVQILLKKMSVHEKNDVMQVAGTLEQVNDKINAIYAGKEYTPDQITLAKNSAKFVGSALVSLGSVGVLDELTAGYTDITELQQSWAQVLSNTAGACHAARATLALVGALGLASAVYAGVSLVDVVDGINHPRVQTEAMLKRMLTIREFLKGFLQNESGLVPTALIITNR